MKIIFASDSFKGSLDCARINELLARAVAEVFPDAQCDGLWMADGGEGTAEAVVRAVGGRWRTVEVPGPLREPVTARYGLLPGNRAIIEMAAASGLPLVPADRRDPEAATSSGTGRLIADALEQGVRDITIAIGGSATNDGGMGALQALGVRFLDGDGRELPGCGRSLGKVARVCLDELHPLADAARFTVMCDVTNTLLGPHGATMTFGAQKGADAAMQARLEEGMTRYAAALEAATHRQAADEPGAGAAGGLGFALMSVLDAGLRSGVEAVLDLVEFDRRLADADLVITGEGRMDWQSAFGKVACGVGRHCRAAGVPAAAIVGSLLAGYQPIYDAGIDTVITTVNAPMALQQALDDSEALYLDAARRLLRAVRCGMRVAGR